MASHPNRDASAQWAIELLASKRYDGKWVLETNDDTISLEDAALGYKGLLVIELCFRSIKRTQIQMMPMSHWLHAASRPM